MYDYEWNETQGLGQHEGKYWITYIGGALQGYEPDPLAIGIACSYDPIHWTKWNGSHLIEPAERYDEKFAHKPWVLKHDGVVYHFYCAVRAEGRVIALATPKDVRAAP
ncbi:MAG: hypothetical protein ABIV50_01465 [Opitutus sp.]